MKANDALPHKVKAFDQPMRQCSVTTGFIANCPPQPATMRAIVPKNWHVETAHSSGGAKFNLQTRQLRFACSEAETARIKSSRTDQHP